MSETLPGEPAFRLIHGKKHEDHRSSSTGATLCSAFSRCPLAAYRDWLAREERSEDPNWLSEHYPFARGTLVHTQMLHLAIEHFQPGWGTEWADAATAMEFLLGTAKPKVKATLKRNYMPLVSSVSTQVREAFATIFAGCEIYSAERPLGLVVLAGGLQHLTYTPLVDLVLHDPATNTYHMIDWKTTSLASGALKGKEEWNSELRCVMEVRSGSSFFYAAEPQFQWMHLVGADRFPGARVKVWAGLIRLVRDAAPQVEMVPVQAGNPEAWRHKLQAALVGLENFRSVSPLGESDATPGQGACFTPYGPCEYWDRCYGA